MTEEDTLKARAQAREFPETMEIMDRIRSALAERLFKTEVLDTKTREEIFLRVQTLDAMKLEMSSLLAAKASDDQIAAYIKELATSGK
jgi:hypothetical protein